MKKLIERKGNIANVDNLLNTGIKDISLKTEVGLVIGLLGFIIQLTPYLLALLKMKI